MGFYSFFIYVEFEGDVCEEVFEVIWLEMMSGCVVYDEDFCGWVLVLCFDE